MDSTQNDLFNSFDIDDLDDDFYIIDDRDLMEHRLLMCIPFDFDSFNIQRGI